MKPRNCNECKNTKNCNSAYGGLGCKYNIKPVLAMIFVLVLGMVAIVLSAKAEDQEVTDEIFVIDAEDIGIKTIKKETVKDEDVVIETESEILDDSVRKKEMEYEKRSYEIEKEEQEQEAIETVEEEDLTEPPEGMVEGYEEGVYFEPNWFECEVCEYCYKCDECTIETTYSYDEEGNYIREETCIVCGHGTSEPVEEN